MALEIFFIRLLVFAVEALEKCDFPFFHFSSQKVEKMENHIFQALLQQKVKVVWKKFPGQKALQLSEKFIFFALEVAKTTS